MGKTPLPDERVVYMALKNVFQGQNAEIRKNKTVRKLIKEHRRHEHVANLVREHNLDVVCSSARTLLCDEIFASTLKAKIRFPELFAPSQIQSAEREASEAEAAQNEADAIEYAMAVELADHQKIAADEAGDEEAPPDVANLPPTSNGIGPVLTTLQDIANVPSLFPIYLPFKSQHKLMVHMQTLLEQACYEFGERTMPDTLHDLDWDCVESMELNRCIYEFSRRQKASPNLFPGMEHVETPLDQLFRSVAKIRHTAVHRIPINGKAIEQFLLDAEALTTLLGDASHIANMSRLRRDTQAAMEELERNKHFLRSRLEEMLRGLAAQRVELERMEEMAVAQMASEDKEYQMLAGRGVEDSIAPSVDTERETVVELEDTLAPSEASFSLAIDTERGTVIELEDNIASPSEASFSTAIDAEEEIVTGLNGTNGVNGTNEDVDQESRTSMRMCGAANVSGPEKF